jgi:hypothetical protein
MLSDLSVQLINPSLLDLGTNPFFINEFAEFILNPHVNFFNPWNEDIVDLCFDYVNVSLIEAPMLLKDFSHFF